LVLIAGILQVQAQNIDCVTDVTYTTIEDEIMYLPQNTAFEDIHPYDIPSLKYTQKTKSHHEWIDRTGDINHEIILTDAINSHEKWEYLSNKWLFNKNGLTSYTIGPKGGETVNNQISYTTTTIKLYDLHKQDVLLKGILVNKVFPANIQTELANKNIPFVVVEPGVTMIGDSTSVTIFNENTPKTITTFIFKTGGPMPVSPPDSDDPNIKETDIDLFDIDQCRENLLSTKTSVVNDTLSNGLCSKRVKTTYYEDYQFDCCSPQPQITANDNQLKTDLDLMLFPNPLNSGTLSIELPDLFVGEQVVLSINTLDGKVIYNIPQMTGQKKFSLNVNKYLNRQGFYVIKAISKDKVITKKFFFVK